MRKRARSSRIRHRYARAPPPNRLSSPLLSHPCGLTSLSPSLARRLLRALSVAVRVSPAGQQEGGVRHQGERRKEGGTATLGARVPPPGTVWVRLWGHIEHGCRAFFVSLWSVCNIPVHSVRGLTRSLRPVRVRPPCLKSSAPPTSHPKPSPVANEETSVPLSKASRSPTRGRC